MLHLVAIAALLVVVAIAMFLFSRREEIAYFLTLPGPGLFDTSWITGELNRMKEPIVWQKVCKQNGPVFRVTAFFPFFKKNELLFGYRPPLELQVSSLRGNGF
jgi:hypothetical protein